MSPIIPKFKEGDLVQVMNTPSMKAEYANRVGLALAVTQDADGHGEVEVKLTNTTVTLSTSTLNPVKVIDLMRWLENKEAQIKKNRQDIDEIANLRDGLKTQLARITAERDNLAGRIQAMAKQEAEDKTEE